MYPVMILFISGQYQQSQVCRQFTSSSGSWKSWAWGTFTLDDVMVWV